jgi:hypothetical protein
MLQAVRVLMVFPHTLFPFLPTPPNLKRGTGETSGASSHYHFTGWKVTASPGTNGVRHNWMWPGARQLPAATLDCSCHQAEPAAGKHIPATIPALLSSTVIAYLPLHWDHSFVVNNCQYHTTEWGRHWVFELSIIFLVISLILSSGIKF